VSGRVRITCKAPSRPSSRDGLVVSILPSLFDCAVLLVDDDGTERELPGVSRIEWTVHPNEVAEARLVVEGVELDAEGVLEHAPPTGCPRCAGLGRFEPHHGATDAPTAPPCATCRGSGYVVIRPAEAP
jgi:hypothetical protein